MNKIDTFCIAEMTISGFKNFTEPRTFTFSEINAVVGKNGQGKTTIGEAIAYAITGFPFFGEAGLDRLYTLEQRELCVALTIVTEDGAAHQLVRSRKKDVTSVTFDGYTIHQNELTTMFGEKDVFLSIFNPLYFIESLGDKGRNLLERYLPAIPHATVMAELSESTRELLAAEDMSAPDVLLGNLRAEIIRAEKMITYTEGQRDLLGTQTIEGLGVLAEKEASLTATNARITALRTKMNDGFDFATMREQLTDLYARRDVSRKTDTSAIDSEIATAVQELEHLRAQQYLSPNTEKLAAEIANFELVKTRYNREKSSLDSIRVGIQCPLCKQMITEENIDAIKQSFSDSIAAMIESGNALRESISRLTESDTAARGEFEAQMQAAIAKREEELNSLRKMRALEVAADSSAAETTLSELNHQIGALTESLEFGGLSPAEKWELETDEKEAATLSTEIATLKAPAPVTSEEKEAELAALQCSVETNKALATAVKYYIDERTKLRFSEFDLLNRVSINLYEIVKSTGEVKSAFKFSFDGKPYKFLSLSEKIKAGLEISALIKRLTERDYPVYIDNGESVPVIDNMRPTGQVFIAQVVKGTELEIRNIGTPTVQNVA